MFLVLNIKSSYRIYQYAILFSSKFILIKKWYINILGAQCIYVAFRGYNINKTQVCTYI